MNTDTDITNDMDTIGKIDVRVPSSFLEAIDEECGRRGYPSRSEAIHDALHDWLKPSLEPADEILDELEVSRGQRERSEMIAVAEARKCIGLGGESIVPDTSKRTDDA